MPNPEQFYTPDESNEEITQHIDDVRAMRRRAELSQYADQPVDFYREGLELAGLQRALMRKRAFEESTVICDVGSSDGQELIDALTAMKLGAEPLVVGVDPSPDAHKSYRRLRAAKEIGRFFLLGGVGEAIPLGDNTADITMAHNSLFRAKHVTKTLEEYWRVTKPGGLVIVRTNGVRHARTRHMLETMVADETAKRIQMPAPPVTIEPPAKGVYWEELEKKIKAIGGFETMARLEQNSTVSYTSGDRIEVLAASLRDSFVLSGFEEQHRTLWNLMVAKIILELEVDTRAKRQLVEGEYFGRPSLYNPDPVHRGMLVMRKIKKPKKFKKT